MNRLCSVLLAIASAALAAVPAGAQDWPSRPVRIVNTFAPGGAADILARIVADHLSSAFKQQFFVETRAGAGGVIGVQTVASAEPDGYNFVITTLSLTIIAPFINPKIGYDPIKDLTHVGYIAGTPILFAVSAKSDITTLKDFDVVANHIDFATPTVTSAAGQLRGGAMTGLAVSTEQRLPDYPDIPTFRELGYDVVATNWFALAGPAGLPADIVRKVNREINVAMERPESQQRMREDGMLIRSMDAAAFRKFIEDEGLRFRPVIERAGLVEK
jgi:tripartite-type tricarboxylate transporter receptor subunit TctC